MADEPTLFDTQDTRYHKLARLLLDSPQPITAIAHLLGDHEGRLDALCESVRHLEAELEQRHGG